MANIRHPELLAYDLDTYKPEARRGEAKRVHLGRATCQRYTKGCWDKHKEELRNLTQDRDISWIMEEDMCCRSGESPT